MKGMKKIVSPWPGELEKLKVALMLLDDVYTKGELARIGMDEEKVNKLVCILQELYTLLFALLNPDGEAQSCLNDEK
ncbi:MAG: hypothetical protein ACPL5F_10470 [Moorellaceae bacterium]